MANRASFRFFVGILFLFALGSCSSSEVKSPSVNFDTKFNKLEVGMEKSQTSVLLGEPDLREAEGSKETWHFKNLGNPRIITFSEGKITSFGAEKPASPKMSQEGEAISIPGIGKIGEACKLNKDCQGGNCHFKICSGPNNCQRSSGETCASDEDCCTSHCGFGICRTKR